MKKQIWLFFLIAFVTAKGQTCTKETFSSVGDQIVARGYTVLEQKADPAVPVQGAVNYVFYVEPGKEYVFVLTSLQDLVKGESLRVSISDSSGKITERMVNEKYVELHFVPRRAEYITIDSWFRSTEKNRDRFCLYHLFAVRKLDSDE